MTKLRLFFFLIISFNVSAETFQATIGVIAAENKPVEIKSKTLDGKIITRSVLIGQPVYLNDEITTQENNKIQILLKDQTAFSMGANSSIVVDKFVYDPNKPELTANIKQGAFKFVSGKISEMKKDTMKVSVPNSVIAVRGTSVAGSINPDGSSTVVLLHGAIGLTSGLNTTDITKAGYGAQISATGLISSPLPIPASTIRSITGSVQQQASNLNNSTNQLPLINNSFDTVTFNNYTFTAVDSQKIQQIATTQGQFAASAAFFNLFGVDVSKTDLNYAYYLLPANLQLILTSITRNDAFNRSITYPWLHDADLTNVYITQTYYDPSGNNYLPLLDANGKPVLTNTHFTYSSAGDMFLSDPNLNAFYQSQIQSFTLDQFGANLPTININGTIEPVNNIYFSLGGSGFNLIDYQNQTDRNNPLVRANVSSQVVNFDFLGKTVKNTYQIDNIPTQLSDGTPSGFVNTSISGTKTASFNQIKNLPSSTTLFYLPTQPVADGSSLGMYSSINLNNSSKLTSSSDINNAVWGLFGVVLTSPTGTTLSGAQQTLGVVNKTFPPRAP